MWGTRKLDLSTGGNMADVRELLKILERQGLTAKMSGADQAGSLFHVEGRSGQFLLRAEHLQELYKSKKLNMAGIKELDEKIQNQAKACPPRATH
jgi:hypothetical protein